MIFAAPPGTAVFHVAEKGWDTNSHLLAVLIDGIKVGNWQRTEAAQKGRDFPKPFPRPTDDTPPRQDTQRPANDAEGRPTTQVGIATASVVTVSKFLELRAQREKRWLAAHPQRRRKRKRA